MKVVLEEEQLMEYRPGSRNRDTEADQNRRNGEMPADQDSRNRHDNRKQEWIAYPTEQENRT